MGMEEDNGPLIVSVSWTLCGVSGFFLGLRLYAKISRRHPLWWDDHTLIFSWILLLIATILTQVGRVLGLGKHTAEIPLMNLFIIAVGLSIGTTITCFASTLSKISFGVTLLRLTSGKTRTFVWFCIISLFVVMLPSAFMPYMACRPVAKTWNPTMEGECWSSKAVLGYGYFNAAWCALADFALALLPWRVIWGLSLSLREKIGVSVAMSMGLLAGMCAIIKGVYIGQLGQEDFSYNGKDVTIWTAVETATAIIGASIPILRVFFKDSITAHSRTHTTTAKSISMPALSLKTYPTTPTDGTAIPTRTRTRTLSRPTGLRSNGGRRSGENNNDDEMGILHVDTDSDDGMEYVTDETGRVFATARASLGPGRRDRRDVENGGIFKTSTVTVEYEPRNPDPDGGGIGRAV